MGVNTTNGFIYLPAMGAEGNAEKALYDAGQQRIDTHMGAVKVLGDPGYQDYPTALATIGSTPTVLFHPPGKVQTITTPVVVPYNVIISAGTYQLWNITTGSLDFSVSPTQTVYWEWWGGVPGIANDASAALIKASHSGISGKTLKWGPYYMRIANLVQFTETQGFTLEGMDGVKSAVYVDVGASINGIVAGVSGTVDAPGTDAAVYNYSFKNFMLIGPANCCKNGLQLSRVIGGESKNVNAILGSTGYAIVQAGTEHFESLWRIGQESDYVQNHLGITYGRAAGGLRMCADGYGWACNTYNKVNIQKTGSYLASGAIGLRLEGVGSNLDITGNIEDMTGAGAYTIYGTDCTNVDLHNIYTEATVAETILLERCSRMILHEMQVGGTLSDGGYTQTTILRSCQATKIIGGTFGILRIEPSCSDTVCMGIGVREVNGLEDFGGNTTYLGGPYQDYSYTPMNQVAPFGENRDNYFTNTLFNNWQTDRPVGWNIDRSNTWTQCGIGKGDTTHHATTYCALIKTGGDTTSPTFTVPTSTIQSLLGSTATFSVWTNLPTGQTWDANDKNFITIGLTVPDWTTGNKTEGYACNVSAAFLAANPTYAGSHQWVCTTAGAAGGAEPAWDNASHQGSTTTDGGVIWTAQNLGGSTILNQPMTTAQADGRWHPKTVSCNLVPWNTTAVNILVYLYRQTGNAQASLYIAEPTLNIGATGSRGVLPGRSEFTKRITVNGLTIVADSYPPDNSSSEYYTGYYFQKGDACLNKAAASGSAPGGWTCTTAGTPGTWKAWANLP